MEYNEKAFAKSANKKALGMWLVMAVVLSIAYVFEVVKGLETIWFYVGFLAFCWMPIIIGLIVLKVKGWHTKHFMDIVGFGYGFFYLYVMLNTKGTLTFTYILPIMSMLIIYKNRKFVLRCGIAAVAVLIFTIVRNYLGGMNTAQDISNFEVQFGIILFCFIGYIVSINHMTMSDGALLSSVENNLERVINTVEQVKEASNSVVDGVTVVRELAEENKQGASTVVTSMDELVDKSKTLSGKIDSSMEMSEDIDDQVGNVAELIENIVGIIEKSAVNAGNSSDELKKAVESTNTMAKLSSDVDDILKEFRNKFQMVKEETGTIEGISTKTNLLALNASIEAARAGDAGKGFAVVAEEIRNLSMGTQASSKSIMDALTLLEETSEKMTESITLILSLIAENLEIMKNVNAKVDVIVDDAKTLDGEIQIVDSAMKNVENSNKSMVENMKHVQDIMTTMTESVVDSETITSTMLSKYDETARNVILIESVVGKLVEELGAGGFMNKDDISEGMSVIIKSQETGKELKTVVDGMDNDRIIIQANSQTDALFAGNTKKKKFEIQIIVNNAVYIWNNAQVFRGDKKSAPVYQVEVEGNPKVINRRKYPRLSMTNTCEITLKASKRSFIGRMVNISAGGFAISCKDEEFVSSQGQVIGVKIHDFNILEERELTGIIIRCTNDNGTFIMGCRMPEDNVAIMNYVDEKLGENNKLR